MLIPFLVAYSHPRCKIFDTDAKDDDIIAFVSDQSCLAYISTQMEGT